MKLSYDLGEAQDGESTNKEAVTLSGNSSQLEEINVRSIKKR